MPNGNTATNNIDAAFTNTYAESASTTSATPKIMATSEDRIINSTMASSSSSTTSSSINNNKRKFRGNDDEEHKEHKGRLFFDEYENQATHFTVKHNGEDEKHNGDDEMDNITHYRDTDILCGKGTLGKNHFGNISYRKQVDLKKALYQKGSRFARVDISKSIVATIRKQNGRFLEKQQNDAKAITTKGGTVRWFDIGDARAIHKTSQALRYVVNAAAVANTAITNTKKQAKKKDDDDDNDDDKNPDSWMTQCCLPQSAIKFLTQSDDDEDDTTTYDICRTIHTAEDFLTASSTALITAYIDYRHYYTANGSKVSAITRNHASALLRNWRAKVKTLVQETVRWFDIGDVRAIQKTSQALRDLSPRKKRRQLPTEKQQVGNNNQLQTTILCVGDDELWTTIFADPPIATNDDNIVTPSKQWIHQQQEMRDVVETDRPIAAPKLEQQIQQQLRMELKSIELQQLQTEISCIANDDTATVVNTSTSELGFCSPICILSSSSRECYSNHDGQLTSMEECKNSNDCTDIFTSTEEGIDQYRTQKPTDALNNTNNVQHQRQDGTTEAQGLILSALIDVGVKREDDRKRKISLLSSSPVTLAPSPLSMVEIDPFKYKQHKTPVTKKNVNKNSPKQKSGDDEITVFADNNVAKSKTVCNENKETTKRAANKPIFCDSNDDEAVEGMPRKRQKRFNQFTDNKNDTSMLNSVSTTSTMMHPFDANVQQHYNNNNNNNQEKRWNERWKQLANYKTAVGDTNVPWGYKKNKQLAKWVDRQRTQYKLLKRGKSSAMTEKRIQSLNKLEFNWQVNVPWEERRKQLANYKNTVGNSNVPWGYKKNKQLATWVDRQRTQYKLLKQGKSSAMTEKRIRSLNELEFNWQVNVPWEERRKQLANYKNTVGDTNVPQGYKKNKQLATWVDRQRSHYRLLKQGKSCSEMTEERIQSLNKLEFNWELLKKQSAIKTATDTEFDEASSELESDINVYTSLSSSSSFSPTFPAASSGTESVKFESITALGDFPISNEYDEDKDNENQHSYQSDDENEDLYLII